jgi:ubiquinone/menaquinone biosynthesis C-methylase UbiE
MTTSTNELDGEQGARVTVRKAAARRQQCRGAGYRVRVYDRVRDSYDRVAKRYAEEIAGELTGKPLDRALLRSVHDLVRDLEESTAINGIVDVGCGPGHIAAHLAAMDVPVTGIDISSAMTELAARRYPEVSFRVGSLLTLPATDGEFAAAVSLYSIIHLKPADRSLAYAEMHRVIAPGGWLLLAFHVSPPDGTGGDIMHADEWWGERVDLDFYYLDPDTVVEGVTQSGFTVMSRTDRQPWPGVEHQSQRCYLLCRRS